MHDVCSESGQASKQAKTQLSACSMMNHNIHQSHVYYPGTLEIAWLICNVCTHVGHRTSGKANQSRAITNQGGNDHTRFSCYSCLWLPFDWHTISCMMFAEDLVDSRRKKKHSWVHAAWWITVFTNHMFIILALWKLYDWLQTVVMITDPNKGSLTPSLVWQIVIMLMIIMMMIQSLPFSFHNIGHTLLYGHCLIGMQSPASCCQAASGSTANSTPEAEIRLQANSHCVPEDESCKPANTANNAALSRTSN